MLQAANRSQPGQGDRHGAPQALQGRRIRDRAKNRRHSLYSEKVVTFEDDAGAYDQRDAEGFIKLNALRLAPAGAARRAVASQPPIPSSRRRPDLGKQKHALMARDPGFRRDDEGLAAWLHRA